jgi:hypothetical protein
MLRPSRAGTATLSAAVKFARRLGNWKTNPTWQARNVARSVSDNVQTSVPSSKSFPSVGLVKAPSMAISVDLPEPERPTTEMNSPRRNSRLAPRTAA